LLIELVAKLFNNYLAKAAASEKSKNQANLGAISVLFSRQAESVSLMQVLGIIFYENRSILIAISSIEGCFLAWGHIKCLSLTLNTWRQRKFSLTGSNLQ